MIGGMVVEVMEMVLLLWASVPPSVAAASFAPCAGDDAFTAGVASLPSPIEHEIPLLRLLLSASASLSPPLPASPAGLPDTRFFVPVARLPP